MRYLYPCNGQHAFFCINTYLLYKHIMNETATYPLCVPEYDQDGSAITAQSLTAFHKQHGLSRMGKAIALAGHSEDAAKSAERKTFKTACETEMMQLIPELLRTDMKEHPPYGLPKILAGERLGHLPVSRAGLHATTFLTHFQTEQLRKRCQDAPTVHAAMEQIAVHTQRSIASIMLEAYTRWKHAHPDAIEPHAGTTAMNAMATGLPHLPVENLLSASGNSNTVMWQLLAVLPAVFEQETGQVPTVEEASEIAGNSIETLELLASAHFHVFAAMYGRLFQAGRGTHQEPNVNPRWFCLRRDGDRIFMALKSEVLLGLPVGQSGSRIRTMCAALLAKADGKSVIQHVYERNVKLAKEMVYPAFCVAAVD